MLVLKDSFRLDSDLNIRKEPIDYIYTMLQASKTLKSNLSSQDIFTIFP